MTNQSMNSKRKTPKGSHEVGYGKPPVEGQFKKGQFCNKRGRKSTRPAEIIDQQASHP